MGDVLIESGAPGIQLEAPLSKLSFKDDAPGETTSGKPFHRGPGITGPSRRTQRRRVLERTLDEILNDHRDSVSPQVTEGRNPRLPDDIQLITSGLTICQEERSRSCSPAPISFSDRSSITMSRPESTLTSRPESTLPQPDTAGEAHEITVKINSDDLSSQDGQIGTNIGNISVEHVDGKKIVTLPTHTSTNLPSNVTLTVNAPGKDQSKVLCVSNNKDKALERVQSPQTPPLAKSPSALAVAVRPEPKPELPKTTMQVFEERKDIQDIRLDDFMIGTTVTSLMPKSRSRYQKLAMQTDKMFKKIKANRGTAPPVDHSGIQDVNGYVQLMHTGNVFNEEFETKSEASMFQGIKNS